MTQYRQATEEEAPDFMTRHFFRADNSEIQKVQSKFSSRAFKAFSCWIYPPVIFASSSEENSVYLSLPSWIHHCPLCAAGETEIMRVGV